MKNVFLSLVVLVLFMSIVSANGLQISPSTIHANKTFGITQTVNFTVRNEEPINFINVQFESNLHILSVPFNISSGENKSIIANITSTIDFIGNMRLKGFYQSNLGEQNQTHNISLSYEDGLSVCDLSIVNGDTVSWKNIETSSTRIFKMINSNTGGEITEIQPNSTYSSKFDTPISLTYYFTRFGVRFTDICTITVLDTQGMINNPSLDAILSLDVKIIYEPTDILVTILSNNYTIEAGTTTQDILSIRNTGDRIAKKVHLSGEWFQSFTTNDFDLGIGESKNIGYTVRPSVNSTNDTNKNYIKNLTIIGNFDVYIKEFNIFIPFKTITTGFLDNAKTLEELFNERLDFVRAYCNDNPNAEECTILFRQGVFGEEGNSTVEGFSIEAMLAMISLMDKVEELMIYIKDSEVLRNDTTNLLLSQSNETRSDVIKINKQVSDSNSQNFVYVLVMTAIILGAALTFLIYQLKIKNKKEEYKEYR